MTRYEDIGRWMRTSMIPRALDVVNSIIYKLLNENTITHMKGFSSILPEAADSSHQLEINGCWNLSQCWIQGQLTLLSKLSSSQ